MEEQKASEKTSKAKKGRSPAYPGISLEESLDRVQIIRSEEGRNEANVDTLLAHWGYKPKSGAGLVVLSALIKFGLLADSGSGKNRKAHLTDLALKILLDDRPDSAERLALIKEAALTPVIHKELWEKYKGTLPSDQNIRYFLRSERQFLDNAADELIKEFRNTISFTKLGESANISQGGEQFQPPEGDIIMNTPEASVVDTQSDVGRSASRSIHIPYTDRSWVKLEAAFPMTEVDWNQMMAVLTAMKPGLVSPQGTPSEAKAPAVKHDLSPEAQELLSKTENGGIPTSMNSNIETIAKQHSITVNSDTTPNEVIKQLRKLQ